MVLCRFYASTDKCKCGSMFLVVNTDASISKMFVVRAWILLLVTYSCPVVLWDLSMIFQQCQEVANVAPFFK